MRTNPPSPPNSDLGPLREMAEARPKVPAFRPAMLAPCAWEPSSSTARSWAFATATRSVMPAGLPHRWVTMIARVRGVISSSLRSGSMLPSGPVSHSTGTARRWNSGEAVAWKVQAGTMTSSPGLILAAQ